MHPNHHNWVLSAMALVSLLTPVPAISQTPDPEIGKTGSWGGNLLNRKHRDQPLPQPAGDKKQSAFELPPVASAPSEHQRLSARLKVQVRKIRLTGNTVFPDKELHRITEVYENRYVNTQDLQQLRLDLTRYYVNRGYVNSGAVIPDQEIKDGIVELRITEGRLTRIDLEGNEHLRDSYLKDRIEQGAEGPLNLDRLQERLLILLEDPLIERINSDLKPGARPGEAILKTLVKEKTPYQFGLIFDNQIAPSIGGYEGTAYLAHRSLTGHGDTFSAQGRFAEGLIGYGFDYWLPVNRYDTAMHAWYTHYDTEIVEAPFNIIDVESKSESYGLSLSHPFYRSPGKSLSASLTMERRRSKTFLLGEPFPFSAGVQDDGESSVTVLRVGQEWINRGTEHVLALRSTFNVGVDALDATINSGGFPDGRFFSWLGQVQWAKRFGTAQLIFRTDLQLANDPLLPLEKFQIGGANSVRGYRENQIVRDWGFASSLEYRHPVFNDFFGEGKFFVAPFVDVGGAWDVRRFDRLASTTPEVLVSVGLGLIWEPDRRFHTHLYWGAPLVDVNNPRNDPQDFGFHFKVAGQFF